MSQSDSTSTFKILLVIYMETYSTCEEIMLSSTATEFLDVQNSLHMLNNSHNKKTPCLLFFLIIEMNVPKNVLKIIFRENISKRGFTSLSL